MDNKASDSDRYLVERVNAAIRASKSTDKMILEHELKFHETDKWYLAYMKQSTYYAARKRAYKELISLL